MNKLFVSLLIAMVTSNIYGVNRASAAVFFAGYYEQRSGSPAPVVATPFTDLGDLPQAQADAVAKLFGLGITIGTSSSTYSPHDPLLPYQFLLFLGRTLMVLENS